jgi:LPXTG-motif cell wall-anchored protein
MPTSKLSDGAIVIGVIGGVCILLAGAGVWFVMRRRQRMKSSSTPSV